MPAGNSNSSSNSSRFLRPPVPPAVAEVAPALEAAGAAAAARTRLVAALVVVADPEEGFNTVRRVEEGEEEDSEPRVTTCRHIHAEKQHVCSYFHVFVSLPPPSPA